MNTITIFRASVFTFQFSRLKNRQNIQPNKGIQMEVTERI